MKTTDCVQVAKYLESYIDDALSGKERELVTAHLEYCIDCQKTVKMLKEVDEIGRIAFYPDPGGQYWASISARVMEQLPPKISVTEKIFSAVNEWFRSPVLVRNLALSSAAVALVALVIKFVYFPVSDQREIGYKSSVVSQTTLSQQQIPPPPEKSNSKNKMESVQKFTLQKSNNGKPVRTTGKSLNNKEQQVQGDVLTKNIDVPFVPRQLNVTPKQPSPGEEKSEMKIPSDAKGDFASQNNLDPAKKENDKNAESFDNLNKDINNGPSTISPRLPKQGISAFDNGKTTIPQGFSIGNDIKNYGNSRSSTTLLNEKSGLYQNKQKTGASLNTLSTEDLVQKKIILREVLYTGKDAKIKNIALLKLDEIYQTLLGRESSPELTMEAKEFYETYRKSLIDLIGIQEYEIRVTRFR